MVQCAPQDPIKERFAADQLAVKKAVHDVYEAVARKDVDRLVSLHLNDPKFSKWDDVNHGGLWDYATSMKWEKDLVLGLKNLKYEIRNLRVDVFGPVALATFLLSYEAQFGNDALQSTDKHSFVFVKQNQEWKLAHEHISTL